MKYFISYSSQTGNTAILSYCIQKYLSSNNKYFNSSLDECDILFIGFWTDKGTCDQTTFDFLKTIRNKKIFLFGTSGFGDSQEYFKSILERVISFINPSNQIIGTYMCQGKMPYSIKERYYHLAENNPEKFIPLIENFDNALDHPNEDDLNQLIKTLDNI